MNYAAFLVLITVILIRPSEIFLTIYGAPLYIYSVAVATLLSLPRFLRLLTPSETATRPIMVCVLGIFAAIPLSRLWNGDLYGARLCTDEFARIVLFYLILVGALTSTGRLRGLLLWIVLCVAVMTSLCVLDYHGVIDLPMLDSRMADWDGDAETGEAGQIFRFQGTGIFNNPNALSRIIVTAILLSIYWLTDPGKQLLAPFWLGLLAMLGHALLLTKSRGGLLGLLAGLAILFVSRFGLKRAVPLALLAMPAALVLFAGRQTELSTSGGTGQHRIQLWEGGMRLLRGSPLFGIGMNNFVENFGFVAHNSFIHAYVELGVFGGMFYVGAFYFAIWGLYRLGKVRDRIEDPILRRARPFLIAVIGAEVAGMMSISLSYGITTYMTLGIATAYLTLVERYPGIPAQRFDSKAAGRLATVGIVAILGLYLFVRFNVRYG